jgi:hypothetical protein
MSPEIQVFGGICVCSVILTRKAEIIEHGVIFTWVIGDDF